MGGDAAACGKGTAQITRTRLKRTPSRAHACPDRPIVPSLALFGNVDTRCMYPALHSYAPGTASPPTPSAPRTQPDRYGVLRVLLPCMPRASLGHTSQCARRGKGNQTLESFGWHLLHSASPVLPTHHARTYSTDARAREHGALRVCPCQPSKSTPPPPERGTGSGLAARNQHEVGGGIASGVG